MRLLSVCLVLLPASCAVAEYYIRGLAQKRRARELQEREAQRQQLIEAETSKRKEYEEEQRRLRYNRSLSKVKQLVAEWDSMKLQGEDQTLAATECLSKIESGEEVPIAKLEQLSKDLGEMIVFARQAKKGIDAVAKPEDVAHSVRNLQKRRFDSLKKIAALWSIAGIEVDCVKYGEDKNGVKLLLSGKPDSTAVRVATGHIPNVDPEYLAKLLAKGIFTSSIKSAFKHIFSTGTDVSDNVVHIEFQMKHWDKTYLYRFSVKAVRQFVDMEITASALLYKTLVAVDGERIRP